MHQIAVNVSKKERECSKCGAVFLPASNRQKRCPACTFYSHGHDAVCEQCGKQFITTGNSTGRFCSRECFAASISSDGTRRRPCPVCGVDFKPKPAGDRYSKTCSRVCAAQLQKAAPLLRTCVQCGAEFDGRRHPHKITCSRICAGIRRREARPLACERCGKEIPSGRYRERRFCSQECRKTPLGSTRPTSAGYTEVKTEDGWRLQHRVLMEQRLGRKLEPHERVHHMQGIRSDNRDEKLELWKTTKKDPAGVRATDYHCAGCRCFEQSYTPQVPY